MESFFEIFEGVGDPALVDTTENYSFCTFVGPCLTQVHEGQLAVLPQCLMLSTCIHTSLLSDPT